MKKLLIICKKCGKDRLVQTSGMLKKTYEKKYPYCMRCGRKKGKINSGLFKKGMIPWNKGENGKYLSHWKGDDVGYDALHEWVERKLGKNKKCDLCGTIIAKRFDWSNKSGKYKRDLNDWQRLCVKCHIKYDYETFGIRKEMFG